jgi:hypothetical protein
MSTIHLNSFFVNVIKSNASVIFSHYRRHIARHRFSSNRCCCRHSHPIKFVACAKPTAHPGTIARHSNSQTGSVALMVLHFNNPHYNFLNPCKILQFDSSDDYQGALVTVFASAMKEHQRETIA